MSDLPLYNKVINYNTVRQFEREELAKWVINFIRSYN